MIFLKSKYWRKFYQYARLTAIPNMQMDPTISSENWFRPKFDFEVVEHEGVKKLSDMLLGFEKLTHKENLPLKPLRRTLVNLFFFLAKISFAESLRPLSSSIKCSAENWTTTKQWVPFQAKWEVLLWLYNVVSYVPVTKRRSALRANS